MADSVAPPAAAPSAAWLAASPWAAEEADESTSIAGWCDAANDAASVCGARYAGTGAPALISCLVSRASIAVQPALASTLFPV
jgi:hypothetical protein